MNQEQTFQKPWQIALLNFHAKLDKHVFAPIERFFTWLNPNNHIFTEQAKPQLRSVK